jgi:hypothetical protein
MSSGVSQQFDKEVGCAIDDLRAIRETVDSIDVACEMHDTLKAIELITGGSQIR